MVRRRSAFRAPAKSPRWGRLLFRSSQKQDEDRSLSSPDVAGSGDGGEGLLEIGEQVAPVFDAGGESHQAIRNAGFRELLLAHAGMSGGFGMAGERFDAAQRHGDRKSTRLNSSHLGIS